MRSSSPGDSSDQWPNSDRSTRSQAGSKAGRRGPNHRSSRVSTIGAFAPLRYRLAGRFTGWLLALVPAYLFGLFLYYSPIAGRSWSEATE